MFFRNKSSEQIKERLAQVAGELEQTKSAIRAAGIRVAQAVAEGTATDSDFGVIASLKAKEAATQNALTVLQAEKSHAERRERLAVASDRRREAERLRSEAADLESKTLKVLEKLSALQEVTFDLSIIGAQRDGLWLNVWNGSIPERLLSPSEARPDIGGHFVTPKSRRLIDEALKLEDDALRIELADQSSGDERNNEADLVHG
jgi:hypothetical protein